MSRKRWPGYADVPADPNIFEIGAGLLPGDGPERIEWLRELIDELEPEHREVVEGLFWERLSRGELADRLGVKRHEIDRRLRAATRALRSAIEERNGPNNEAV